jgi:hypothetical protein
MKKNPYRGILYDQLDAVKPHLCDFKDMKSYKSAYATWWRVKYTEKYNKYQREYHKISKRTSINRKGVKVEWQGIEKDCLHSGDLQDMSAEKLSRLINKGFKYAPIKTRKIISVEPGGR